MANLKFIRTPKSSEAKFVRIDLRIYRNDKLSAPALGILTYLLSHSNSYDLKKSNLKKRFNLGRDAFSTIWKELLDSGYVMESKSQNSKGQWEWNYTISELPIDGSPTCGSAVDGSPNNKRTTNVRTINRRTNKPLKEVPKGTSYGDIEELSSSNATRISQGNDNDTLNESLMDSLKGYVMEQLNVVNE
jgi:hypothetical protein